MSIEIDIKQTNIDGEALDGDALAAFDGLALLVFHLAEPGLRAQRALEGLELLARGHGILREEGQVHHDVHMVALGTTPNRVGGGQLAHRRPRAFGDLAVHHTKHRGQARQCRLRLLDLGILTEVLLELEHFGLQHALHRSELIGRRRLVLGVLEPVEQLDKVLMRFAPFLALF